MTWQEYWCEAVESAFDDVGAFSVWESLTADQKRRIGRTLEGAAEEQGQCFYQPENPLLGETERLRRELAKERAKVGCHICRGSGRLQYYSGPWAVDTQCHTCHGEGKVAP